MTDNQLFISPSKGAFAPDSLVKEIVAFMNESDQSQYRLVIGTDSKSRPGNGQPVVEFVSAIVIHRQGSGGRYFWRRTSSQDKQYQILRNKIYQETTMSLNLAGQLVPLLKSQLNGLSYSLEIHIDVGEAGPTREMIREVVGMVTGNGYVAKTKPDSYGASTVADKHT